MFKRCLLLEVFGVQHSIQKISLGEEEVQAVSPIDVGNFPHENGGWMVLFGSGNV